VLTLVAEPVVAVGAGVVDTPNTVPVICARLGLLEELIAVDTHAGGPAV
jgi:hypothetical protein